jgi:hypothetical protein
MPPAVADTVVLARCGSHEQLAPHDEHLASLGVGHHVELDEILSVRTPVLQQADQVMADGRVVLQAVDASDLLVDPAEVPQAFVAVARVVRTEGLVERLVGRSRHRLLPPAR